MENEIKLKPTDYARGNEFLLELKEKETPVTVFVKNGVQLHGTIAQLYKDYFLMHVSTGAGPGMRTNNNYIRYDAVSTILERDILNALKK